VSVSILIGDCRERMAELDADSIDSAVTDPPYHLTSIVKRFGAANAAPAKVGKTGAYARASRGFMGQTWDGGDVAFDPATWEAVYRVLKPGAHLVAFGAPRTYGRMQVAIEDAGFEVRDGLLDVIASDDPVRLFVESLSQEQAGAFFRCIEDSQFGGLLAWVFGSGFPKSHNQPGGWGTAIKPAFEPIILARKPLQGTVAANLAAHGTGALNIDACRIATTDADARDVGRSINRNVRESEPGWGMNRAAADVVASVVPAEGRWPANIIHDGSDEVLAGFPAEAGAAAPASGQTHTGLSKSGSMSGHFNGMGERAPAFHGDSGSAARFFYCAKATTEERGEGNNHPTVKPIDLMRWLCRLVTPRGGTVLDPFAGSGSTLIAADAEQFHAIGCELSPDYAAIAERRVRDAAGMFAEVRAA
jgi:site-specific DNA-methyltransferase (adenine-specific)